MADSHPTPPTFSRSSIAINVLLQVLLGFGIVLGVNLISYKWYARWDLSPSGTYTLSSSTLNFLQKLSKDVDVTVLFARGDEMYDDVHALTDEYRRHGKERIKVQFVDPTRDRDRAEQLKVENGISLQQNGILVKANKGTRFIKQEEMVILSQGMDKDHPRIDFRGEDALTSALVGLLEGARKKFYFITGKGARAEASESDLIAALTDLGKQQNFEVKPLNLGEVTTNSLPTDANGILLIGPKYDLSDREASLFRAYWSQRRVAMLILLEPDSTTPRLDAFLKTTGISPRNDRVLFAERTGAGVRKEFNVEAAFSKDSSITKSLRDVTTTLAGQTLSLALEPNETKLREQGLEVTPLITAARRFWGETSYLDELPILGEDDTPAPVQLAASVERGGVQNETLRVDSARLVVVGNASLLDKNSRLAVNQDFLAASLNWMLNRERLIGITSKQKRQYRIQLSDHQRDLIFWITTLCAPALVMMFGISVWAKRRAT
jgi:hypothetical protein